MGLFSRKKQAKQSPSSPQPESPALSREPSRPSSPLPPPGQTSSSSRFGSTTSLPPTFASSPEPIPQRSHLPDEPYVLPSLSLSPLGITPPALRSRTSSDGRVPGTGAVRDSYVLVQPDGDDDDDAPLGLRGNRNGKAMRFFGLGKGDGDWPASVSEEGHHRRGSLGGDTSEGYTFRFTESPIGGSSRGVAGEQERYIKGTSPSSTSTALPPRHHPTSDPDTPSDPSYLSTSKKTRPALPPPLLSFSPPARSSSLANVCSEALEEPRPAFADEGSSSAQSSTGRAGGKRRFMGMFTGSKENLSSQNAAGGEAAIPTASTSSPPASSATTLAIPFNPYSTTATSPLSATTPALPSPAVATPRPQRPHAVSRPSSSFLFSALKIGSRGNNNRASSPSNDQVDDDGQPLRPPSPASSFRLISARHITTPPPPTTEDLMATPAVVPQRPLYPRQRSQSVEWTGSTSALVDEDDEEENLVEEKRVPVAVFRRRQSDVGLVTGAKGLELDLGGLEPALGPPSTVEKGPEAEPNRVGDVPSPVAASSFTHGSSFARNKGFVVASRANRNTVTSVPSSSASSTHSQESRGPPKSTSTPSFVPPASSPSEHTTSPLADSNARLPSRPPRAASRPVSSPPSSPPSRARVVPTDSHSRRPSSSFFPLEPDYTPAPLDEILTSPMLGSARPASRSSSHLPPPPPPVGSQPLANSPKPISRYHAAKASKPVPPPAPAPKPVARRHYSSTEEESSESAASSDDDDGPGRKHRRDRTAGSRSSFSSNKTFTRGVSASHADREPSTRSKSPSASMFSSSGQRRPVGKPLMAVEGVAQPILDRRVTIRRASAADVDRVVEQQQPEKKQSTGNVRRGSDSVLAKMAPAEKKAPPPPAAVEENESSDGYGYDDPTPPASKPVVASVPSVSEESDEDDRPLGMIARTQASPAVPILKLPSSSLSPSKSTPSSLGLRGPASQPFLGRSPHRSTSSLSVAPSTASSASSSTSASQPRSILRNAMSPPSAPVTLPSSTRPPPSRPTQSPITTTSKLVVNTAGAPLPSPPGTSSGYSSNPTSPLPPPDRISGSSLNRSAASPSSSLTGDSSSGRTPLTPREGMERERARERSGLGVGKRWGDSTAAESVPLKPIDEDEAERRRKERRRGEARNAIELGNVFHGPPPVDPDSETDTPSPNHLDQHPQYPYVPNPHAVQPQFGPGGFPAYMPMGGMSDATSMWALQAQIQAQQAQMLAMQMAMQAQMGGGDPSMHYQSMMMAKQQFQAQMAAQAAQLAGDQWEMSSNMGGPMSDAGGSVRGGPPSLMGHHQAPMAFPGMMSGFGGGGYAGSAYGGGGGSNWGGSEVGWGGGGARSEYGGGASRSEYGGGPARTRHQSGSGLSMMGYTQHHQQSPPQHLSQLRASPSNYFARNQQLPSQADALPSSRQRQVSQPVSQQGPSSGRPPPTSRSSQSFFKDSGAEQTETIRQPRRRDKSSAVVDSTSPGANNRPLSIIAPPARPFVDDEPSSGGRSPGGGPPSSWRTGSPDGRRRR